MKRLSVLLLIAVLALAVTPACKKSGGSTEATLAVTITPANGSTNLNLLGPDFPLKVEITSTMPPSGVKIDISAQKDGSSDPAFFTSTNNSTAGVTNYTITNTPSSVTCVVTVTVTSISNSGNKWTGTYRYSKK